MNIKKFPPVYLADPETGLLAIGGDLAPQSLHLAYSSGIFPWPVSINEPIPWFAPPQRAILFTKDFHISQSLQKLKRQKKYKCTINKDFPAVIRKCQTVHQQKGGTWINENMLHAYTKLHHLQIAHSIECYNKQNQLVGGLYGISIGQMFAGESMFHIETGASKIAFCFLMDYLQQHKIPWIDCQQLTPLFKNFGAREIPRNDFMKLLEVAIQKPSTLFQDIEDIEELD